MALGTNLLITLALIAGPFLYQRISMVQSLRDNAPGKLQTRSVFKDYEIKFAEQLRNCEDVILLEDVEGVALLSCDESRDQWNTVMGIFKNPKHQGQLYLYDYASPDSQPRPLELLDFPDVDTDFHPLGIAYDSSFGTLYVINHAQTGSRLEIFHLLLEDHVAKHIQTVAHPQIHSPNSIAVLNDHTLYITNDHYFLSRHHPWLAKLETWLAPSTGSVILFDIASRTPTGISDTPFVDRYDAKPATLTVLDHIAFANGVAVIDDHTLAVASTNNLKVYIYHAPPTDPGLPHKLYLKHTITLPFLPDNLSVDSNGKLLIAGHPHPFSMIAFAQSRDACNSEHVEGPERERACAQKAGTGVAEWSEKEGLRVLYMGGEFATGSTAVRDVKRGVGIVGGLYERGLLVWRE